MFIPHYLTLHLSCTFPDPDKFPPDWGISLVLGLGENFFNSSYTFLLSPLDDMILFKRWHLSEQKGENYWFFVSKPSHDSLNWHLGFPHKSSCLCNSYSFIVFAHFTHLTSSSLYILMRARALIFYIELALHLLGQDLI